jgi:alkanesulfonate monooxygenase SsuD/methylene tetrahydromethanopterin reductase-like flavin-dependent oxidoreductase (luciferase family)
MRYGVVFPQIEFGNDPAAIKEYAQTAEALGYDYLLVYDHVLGAHPDREPGLTGPYTHQNPFHEPMVLFGFLTVSPRAFN